MSEGQEEAGMNFGKDIVNIDLECTGSDRRLYSICEIGAVLLDKCTLEIKGEFESLIFPYRENFDPSAMKVHGIPKEDLYRAPTLVDVLDTFQLWILREAGVESERKVCLSAWGAYFDIPYLKEAYFFLNREYPFDFRYLDIKAIARWEFALLNQPLTKGGLARCARLLNIPFDESRRHRALEDARLGGLVVKELKERRARGV